MAFRVPASFSPNLGGSAPPPDGRGRAGSASNGSARRQLGGGAWCMCARALGRPLVSSRGRTRVEGALRPGPRRAAAVGVEASAGKVGDGAGRVNCRFTRQPTGRAQVVLVKQPLETCSGIVVLSSGPT